MKWINYKKRIFRRIGKSLGKIGIFAGVICFAFYGISILGGTSSYFNDTEDSNANTFSAGTLNFSLDSAVGFSPITISKGESTIRTINLNQDGSLDFQYSIKVDNLSGGACNYLNLTANLDGTDVGYTGLIKDFIYGPITFSAPEEWIFTVTLQTDAPDSVQGEICNFDFIFDGTQIGGNGFYDQETINNNVAVKYWSPPVVLNEFLPDPLGDDCSLDGVNGEWIEIYNQTPNEIDLNNWYIKDETGHQILIQTSNTLSGSTIIGAQGSGSEWLVVFMDDCILNNDGDTITFYNFNDVQIDSYAYTAPDYNINNTPGATNGMILYMPLDNDLIDQSGNGNNGINNGTVFTDGKINKGLSFDGNDNVSVSGAENLNSVQITLEVWVKNTGSPGAYKYIIDKHYSGSYASYGLYTGSSGGLRFYIGHSGGFVLSPGIGSEIWDGNWHHIIGTYDNLKVRLYVDGTEIGDGTTTGVNIIYNAGNLYIGSYGNGFYWNGLIDEVKIYNRAISELEVLSHYGQIPVNKSYARIPDGSSNWVDPVPTPGTPNILILNNNTETEIKTTEEFVLPPEEIVFEQTTVEIINNVVEEIVEETINNIEPIIQEETEEVAIEEITEEEIITEATETTEPIANEEEEPLTTTEESLVTEGILATEELLIPEEQTIVEEQETDQLPVSEGVATEELTTEEIITEEIIIEETIEDVPVQESIIEIEPITESEPVIIEEPTDEEPISSE